MSEQHTPVDSPLVQQIGSWLEQQRQRGGLSYRELGRKVRLTDTHVRHICRGCCDLKVSTLEQIAAAYGMSALTLTKAAQERL